MRVPRLLAVTAIWLVTLHADAHPVTARAEEPVARTAGFEKRRDVMLGKGVRWLLAQQRPSGSFADEDDNFPHATTARACHALRVAGVHRDHPALARAYAALIAECAEADRILQYSRSSLGPREAGALLLCITDRGIAGAETGASPITLDDKDRSWVRKLTAALETTQRPDGTWKMFPSITDTPSEPAFAYFDVDMYLGLEAAGRAGVTVNPKMWERALADLRRRQAARGATVPGPTAGTLITARGWTLRQDSPSPSWGDSAVALVGAATCLHALSPNPENPPIRDLAERLWLSQGVAFLEHGNLDESGFSPGGSWFMYRSLVAFERAATRFGIARFGDVDWYRFGVDALGPLQATDGGWGQGRSGEADKIEHAVKIEKTSYALRFLAGRAHGVRWSVTAAAMDTDPAFGPPASRAPFDAADFVGLVLVRWRKATEPELKARLFAKATEVGAEIVPPLLLRLASDSEDDRAAAIALLLRATGLDHGFVAEGPAAERTASIARWKAWWKEAEPTLRYDPEKRTLVK